MALSPNYGWSEPDNSSLVKNGAADIRTLGDSIDTSVWNIGFGQAGKNKIINGDFGIWQRGTSGFALGGAYNADRFGFYTGTSTNKAVTRQTFTPGAAPVAGYEGEFFWRYAESVATVADANVLYQKVEDVREFAGQTATLSFYAKSTTASSTFLARLSQNFGSGGSTAVDTSGSTVSLTTSWARYSVTFTVPSISGKTIGTSSFLEAQLRFSTNLIQTIDIWGMQLEYGSKATPFQTASGGSPQAELAMCQRYYQRSTGTATNTAYICSGVAISTTRVFLNYASPVTMRTAPSVAQSSGSIGNGVISNQNITTIAYYSSGSLQQISLDVIVGSGLTTSGFFVLALPQNAYIELSAEL